MNLGAIEVIQIDCFILPKLPSATNHWRGETFIVQYFYDSSPHCLRKGFSRFCNYSCPQLRKHKAFAHLSFHHRTLIARSLCLGGMMLCHVKHVIGQEPIWLPTKRTGLIGLMARPACVVHHSQVPFPWKHCCIAAPASLTLSVSRHDLTTEQTNLPFYSLLFYLINKAAHESCKFVYLNGAATFFFCVSD